MDTRAYNLRLGDAVVVKRQTRWVDKLETKDGLVEIQLGDDVLLLPWGESVQVREFDRRDPGDI